MIRFSFTYKRFKYSIKTIKDYILDMATLPVNEAIFSQQFEELLVN